MLGLRHGPLWWIVILYQYSLIAVLSILLLRQIFTSTGYSRSQAGSILVAVAFVWIVNAIYVSGNSPVPNMDISSIAFIFVAGSMAWGFFRYRLLDILPVAKAEIFRRLEDIILVIDEKDRILDLNPAAESIFKVKTSQIIGQEASKAFNRYPRFQKGIGWMESSEICLMQDGQEHVFDLRVSFITDKHGLKLGKIIALRDITDRKQAEEAIQANEKRYKTLVYNIPGMVYRGHVDWSTEIISGSVEVCGFTNEEINSKEQSWLNIIHPADKERILIEASKFGKEQEHWIQIYRIMDEEGRIRWMEDHKSPLFSETGEFIGVDGVVFDITEHKLAEEEKERLKGRLHRAQKMEAIGTLAGGVAHDLNNILGGLVSYPELLLLKLPEESPLREPILTIQKSGEKAAAVVQDLLTLARRGVVVTEVVNLNDVIAEYLKSPEHKKLQSYHPGVQIETHLEKDVLNILGSSTHLSKTAMNLIANAAEAMPEGGQIAVSTENRYIDRPIRGYDDVKEGDYVVLTISDTGTGISPEDMEKIFEPFYTKKKMGRSGTGLGMAVVWGTVKDHNGYIHVQSTEGSGTTFSLYFPVTRKTLEERSETSLKDYMGKGEAILVVDDVEEQRKIASGMLKELGYSVVSVASGEEAVEYLKTNKVDLLLLDMIMDPGLDGLDTYKQILKTNGWDSTP